MLRLPDKLEKQLNAYRTMRKQERGAVIFRENAIIELLTKALDGIEPPRPINERLDELEKRVAALEGRR